MKIFKPVIVAAALAGLAVVPLSANAAPPRPLWVSSAAVSAADNSCAKPGYNTIQSAITAAPAGATINICAGTYTEQLTITQPVSLVGQGSPTVQLPAAPVDSATACDTAPGTGSYQPDQDGIVICGAGTVSIDGLTLDEAWPANTCYDSLYGVLVAGGSTLDLTNSTMVAGGAVPLNGCQGGIGIQIGMAWTTPVEVGHANLLDDNVSGYQKNGITVDGTGSGANIDHTKVTGIGPTVQTAQNGIQISNGASGAIFGSTITADECNLAPGCGSDSMADYQAAGVLLYGAAAGTSVTDSTISNCDIGVYYSADTPSAPHAPTATITGDTLLNDRYEGILLDQGWAAISADVINGGNVGIQVLQYGGQAYSANGTALLDSIRNQSVAAVQVYSDHSHEGDLPGLFTIAGSDLRGNAARVLNNSSHYTVLQVADL